MKSRKRSRVFVLPSRRRVTILSTLGASLVLSLAATANAAPNLRVQVEQKGDFIMFGNTLGYDCAGGTPAPVVGTVGNCGNNTGDTSPDIYWRSDAPMAGQAQANNTITAAQARSTAVLNLPAGATVTHAYIYWAGTFNTPDTQITLERPGAGGFSSTVDSIQSYTATSNATAYQSVADITSIVQANGSGAYRVSGISVDNWPGQNINVSFGGWWIVVLYELGTDPLRNLAVFDGLDPVGQNNPQNTSLSGFLVPPFFTNAKLGIVAYEGDATLNGDQFFFNDNNNALTDALNPADNFFNGTRSNLGVGVSNVGDLPQLTGTAQSMGGMDLDIVDVTSKITAGQTSATIRATSSQDVYFLAGFVTSIPSYKPDFSQSTKSATDDNGDPLVAGDTVTYTVNVVNQGTDTSINTVLTDPLPAGVTYVPGSLQITSGANSGAKTDQTGDDQGEFDAGSNTVIVRLGTGANAMQGGTMAIGETATVSFKVTINSGVSGYINNQAIITAAGQQGAPSSDTPTDGNGPTGGSPPTPIVVDACLSDGMCAAPTPFCDTGSSPKVCVECLMDSQCPVASPTCDPATKTCTCVPSGAEICDGKDNDCNGTVDDSFNVGQSCTVGIGACQATGVFACDMMGGSACTAQAGMPMMELCNDTLDTDCDGNPHNGCTDTDGDGLPDELEIAIGTDPNDADSDDDGVPDGMEPSATEDTDGDGLINALDPDSDNDGLYDGTEMGLPCSGTGTNAAIGHCVADADNGATTTNPLDADSDDGGVSDGSEDFNRNGAIDPGETDPTAGHGGDDGSVTDTDGDGLSDAFEDAIGTDPNDADSDDDGVPDGQEPNPGDDTDGDGLINALDPDSDNDGLYDGTELGLSCSNPATDLSVHHCRADGDSGATKTGPLSKDTDHGGKSDGSEDTNLNGVIDAGETDPTVGHGADDSTVTDTDGDGLSDDLEDFLGTDPNDADSDDDGVPDGQEPNPGDDTDGDGLINALDPDSDNDGLFDGTEMGLSCSNAQTDLTKNHCIADADNGATKTSPLDPDTDDGGVTDGSEDTNRNGAIDQGETDPTVGHPGDDGSVIDTDGDGLSDASEGLLGTDPNDADSDDDGVPDGQEANLSDDTDGDGTINALDPDSDNDGLFDGTEMGYDCSNTATDTSQNHCVADGDNGTTKTSPLLADTDGGSLSDGTEDANHNGVIDNGETDPNDPSDDVPSCAQDSDCGNATSGMICDDTSHICVTGCRGSGGNGCPDGQTCTSTDNTPGTCENTAGGSAGASGSAGSSGSGGSSATGGSGGSSGSSGTAGSAATGGTNGGSGATAGAAGTGGTATANPSGGLDFEGGGFCATTPQSQTNERPATGIIAAMFGALLSWRRRRSQ